MHRDAPLVLILIVNNTLPQVLEAHFPSSICTTVVPGPAACTKNPAVVPLVLLVLVVLVVVLVVVCSRKTTRNSGYLFSFEVR